MTDAQSQEKSEHIDYCPWCGDELQGENKAMFGEAFIRECPNHGDLSIEVRPL